MSEKPKLQVGETDPYINERIIHVAEMDLEAFKQQWRKQIWFFLLIFILAFCFLPCLCLLFFFSRRSNLAKLQRTELYLTEHTLVYNRCEPNSSKMYRTTIPLNDIASALVESGVVTVTIKPTAPEVNLLYAGRSRGTHGSGHTHMETLARGTRTLPIHFVQDPEGFAEVIKSNLQ